jgi:hypothetical protein
MSAREERIADMSTASTAEKRAAILARYGFETVDEAVNQIACELGRARAPADTINCAHACRPGHPFNSGCDYPWANLWLVAVDKLRWPLLELVADMADTEWHLVTRAAQGGGK